MKILVTSKPGYQWFKNEQIYFKGYFICKVQNEDVVFRGDNALQKLQTLESFDEFVYFLKAISGSFSIIIKNNNCIWAAVDIARSLPIFFTQDGNMISDSAEQIRKELSIKKDDICIESLAELYANYYLFGHKTVYDKIKQLDLGEALELTETDNKIVRYFHHINEIESLSQEDLKAKISNASYNAFNRIKIAIANRPVVLSMSGGYDSRFVGCMLKNIGIEDVSCYTYGKSSSFEVIQSKKNAEALGFRWTCVEMKDELVKKNLDDIGKQYLDSYDGHDFTAYMQNFAAVRKLHEDGWFKPNSVFLTGLCGDMPTGEYVLGYNPDKEYSVESVAEALYKLVFKRYQLKPIHKTKWICNIKEQITNLPICIKDYHSWHQVLDCLYTGTCHAHWYMHMNTVHSFFGYEWLLPYWDKELLMTWYSVPSEYKVKQKIYEDWLMEDICKPYGINQKKTIISYSNNKQKRKIQYMLGGLINFIVLHLGIPFKRKQDYNNFAPMEVELFKNIKDHSTINYRRAGMMQLLDNYLLERRYGISNVKRAIKYLNNL